ncbi:hypothetical protein [Eubacterium callanderi]|uniref:hypothetical protein n=1 Tax=Eubacterium callanderi TaxID=53442 RepID=UPI001AA0F41C|nr:hypothetical protein [Eubacterium callanderi]MBO1701057.1 hypothetical protein [Eubacterium callanderi]
MSKNYMSEIAQMLGVEIGEEFNLLNEDGEIVLYSPYKFTGDSIIDYEGNTLRGWRLWNLLTGEYTLQKRPWRLKDGGEYWYVSSNGKVYTTTLCATNACELAMLNMGNCFLTEEAAEAAVPEMLAKFEEIKKGVRE